MSGVLLVTGGSRGIGRDVALRAGERGWDVVVNYTTSRDAAEAVAAENRPALSVPLERVSPLSAQTPEPDIQQGGAGQPLVAMSGRWSRSRVGAI